MKTVAIIGGGITGLTTAFELHRKNIPVTLYEASHRAGGVIRSLRLNGYLAEYGPNSILETSPKIGELIRDLGLEARRVRPAEASRKRYIVQSGKLVRLPGSALGLVTTPILSAGAKLRILREPFIARMADNTEESVADFVIRRLGPEFLDYFVSPFVGGIYAGDPKRLSVEHAFPRLFALEKRYGSLIKGQLLGARERKRRAEKSRQSAEQFSFDDGLQVLTEALYARLRSDIQLCAPVSRIAQRKNYWTVTSKTDGNIRETEHAAVIFAGPAHRLPQIELTTNTSLNYTRLGDIHYPPVTTLVLGFRRENVKHPLDGFGMLVPEIERLNILGTIFSSSLFPHRAPSDRVTLTSFIGGSRAPHLAGADPDVLLRLTLDDLRKTLGIEGEPTFIHHTTFQRAIPQYEIGFGRFKSLMNEMEAKAPGFFLAGNYRDGISLADSILSSSAVAERAAKHLFRSREHQIVGSAFDDKPSAPNHIQEVIA